MSVRMSEVGAQAELKDQKLKVMELETEVSESGSQSTTAEKRDQNPVKFPISSPDLFGGENFHEW